MKQVFLYLAGTAVFITALGLFLRQSSNDDGIIAPPIASPKQENKITINDQDYSAEIADSDKERERGLSKRDSLAVNGMLFILEKENSVPSFWMKDMQFEIDIFWINDDQIVQIDKNVPLEPDVADSDLSLYQPTQPVDLVFETVAGFADDNNIKAGDSFFYQE